MGACNVKAIGNQLFVHHGNANKEAIIAKQE